MLWFVDEYDLRALRMRWFLMNMISVLRYSRTRDSRRKCTRKSCDGERMGF